MKLLFGAAAFVVVAAAAAAEGEDTGDTRENGRFKELIDWVRSKGGFVSSKIEFRGVDESDPSSYTGMFATEDIPAGRTILSIPPETFITPGHDVYEDDHPNCDTVAKLAREMKLGNASAYAPYTTYLLSQEDGQLPSDWSDEGKEMLSEVIGEHLPPKDPADWVEHYVETCDEDDPLHIKAALLNVQRGWDEINIPIFDLTNHRNGKWVNTESNDDLDWVTPAVVKASKNIKKGEQLYTTYTHCETCGARKDEYGTPEMFRDYGLVEDYPQKWVLEEDVIFEVDQGEDDSIFITWVKKPENAEEYYKFLKEEYTRMMSMSAVGDLQKSFDGEGEVPETERLQIMRYHAAMTDALKLAYEDLKEEFKDQTCKHKEADCSGMDFSNFNDLRDAQNEIELDWETSGCDFGKAFYGRTEKYREIEKVNSKYQVRFLSDEAINILLD